MENLKTKPIDTIWNRNFICILSSAFMLSIAHFSVNPLVASYAVHLGASAFVTGILAGLLFAVALSMRPVTGPVITKFDKRKLMILVFFIGGLANIGYALFDNISAFIVFRFIHGLQYALVGALTMTLAGDNLPKEKMASGLGIYSVAGTIGMALAPTLGVYVLNFGTYLKDGSFGFTCLFLFSMIICFLGVIPSYILLPDKKTKEEILSTGSWYKNIASVHAAPMAIIMFFTFMGWSLYNVYIIEFAKELGISGESYFYIVLAVVLGISRPACGWLTDRFGLVKILSPALIIFAASFFIVGYSTSLGTLLGGAVIASIGFGSFQPAIYSMCILSETPLKRGVASNTLYIGIDIGLSIGPVLGGIVNGMYDYATMFKAGSSVAVFSLIVFILILPAYYRRRRFLESTEAR